jgi:hypothetical protein
MESKKLKKRGNKYTDKREKAEQDQTRKFQRYKQGALVY